MKTVNLYDNQGRIRVRRGWSNPLKGVQYPDGAYRVTESDGLGLQVPLTGEYRLSHLERANRVVDVTTSYSSGPSLITGLDTDLLEFWDADDAASITVTGAGVSSWVGLKNSISLDQTTDANRPLYNTTQWGNSKSSLSFGDTTKRLASSSFAALPDGSDTFEVWLVLSQDSGSGTQRIINFPSTTNGSQFYISHWQTSGEDRLRMTSSDGSGANVEVQGSTAFTGKQVIRARVTASALQLGMGADCQTSKLSSTAFVPSGLGATGILAVGAGATGGSIWTGLIRKILFTKLLNDEKAFAVYEYCTAAL